MRASAVLLMGPTGAGKSDVAIGLATRLPLEVVSVDSVLVYRGLDIGTAKPAFEVRARIPHHLIDVCDPLERYSVGRFLNELTAAVAGIRARGKVPLLVGGTMLYFRALQAGLATLPSADPELRARLSARAAASGWPALHAELARQDPAAAARIQPTDAQRIQRALEVRLLTGVPLSELQRQDLKRAGRAGDLKLVLAPAARTALEAGLERRFDRMLAAGLLAEVAALRARGDLDPSLPAMRAVGYRQLWAHLEGHCELAAARAQALAATRQLAKRQYTWLRAERDAEWFEPGARELERRLARVIEEWCERHAGVQGPLC